jgi:segregation and condensation protein B
LQEVAAGGGNGLAMEALEAALQENFDKAAAELAASDEGAGGIAVAAGSNASDDEAPNHHAATHTAPDPAPEPSENAAAVNTPDHNDEHNN